jgi:O-antigen/teichoic acid export membrane protein
MIFLIVFSASLGPIPFQYVNDVFQRDARSSPARLCIIINWICASLVALYFEFLIRFLNEYVFLIFASVLVINILYILIDKPPFKSEKIFKNKSLILYSKE